MARAHKAVLKRNPATKTTQDRRCWPRFVPNFRRTSSTTSPGNANDSPSKKGHFADLFQPFRPKRAAPLDGGANFPTASRPDRATFGPARCHRRRRFERTRPAVSLPADFKSVWKRSSANMSRAVRQRERPSSSSTRPEGEHKL